MSNISSVGSSNYNGISGLASGLDTEDLVAKLTSLEQGKITSAQQNMQILEWKQEYYHEIISKLNTFKNTYFSSSSSSYMSSASLNCMSVSNSGSQYVTVTPGSNATAQNVVISDIVSLASASKLESSEPASPALTLLVDPDTVAGLSGKAMKVSLDGVEKTITFSQGTYESTEDALSELQSLLDKAFGENRISASSNGDNLTLESSGSTIVIRDSGIEGAEASEILGFTSGASNKLSTTASLASLSLAASSDSVIEFTVNGTSFSFTGADSLSKVMQTVNESSAGVKMTYSSLNDTFTLTSSQTGTGNPIETQDGQGGLLTSLFSAGNYTEGTNAVIKICTNASSTDPSALTFTTITRNTNTFDIDGNTYTLLGKASGAAEENINIGLSFDIENSVNKITSFVNAYNDLLKTLNDKLYETRYKDYPPLTDEQRAELTESEAKTWDEKAKSGLLRNDSVLQSITTALRSAMFTTVQSLTDSNSSIGMILTDTGIKTGVYSEKGKLHIDEAALRKALTNDPSTVIKLFTQESSLMYSAYATDEQKALRYSESGLFNRISDIISTNTRTTGIKGNLITLVGKDSSSKNDIYSKKISDMQNLISKLKDRLTERESYYFKKFSSMESALSLLNTQSAWLNNMMTTSSY